MKTFVNTKTSLTGSSKEVNSIVNLNYSDLVLINLNDVGEKGLLPIEMEERIELIKLFKDKQEGDKIELNQSQVDLLLDCNQKTRWTSLHEDIDSFNKYVKTL